MIADLFKADLLTQGTEVTNAQISNRIIVSSEWISRRMHQRWGHSTQPKMWWSWLLVISGDLVLFHYLQTRNRTRSITSAFVPHRTCKPDWFLNTDEEKRAQLKFRSQLPLPSFQNTLISLFHPSVISHKQQESLSRSSRVIQACIFIKRPRFDSKPGTRFKDPPKGQRRASVHLQAIRAPRL